MMKLLLMLLFLLILLVVGTYCLFFPYNVQALASKMIEMGPTSKSQALRAFLQSKSYIVNVRAVGIGAYAMFALLVFALYKGGAS